MSLETPKTMIDTQGGRFTVRRYQAADRPELEEMYEDFRPKRAAQGLPPDGELRIRRWLDAVLDRGHHIVVEIAGRVMGHAMLIPMDGDAAVELANFLHQSVRNRGIGTELNRVAVREAAEHGYDRVWLSVEPSNRAAVRSYRKAGFELLPGSLMAPEIEMEAAV